ncbi:MAG: RNA methyltransferase, partial [Pseudomonadota bacterium]
MTPPPAELRFILVRPREPGNIGAVARAIAGMGFESLWLVAPEQFPHPQASQRAAEAADVVDRIRVTDSLEDALAGCEFAVACSARQRHNRWPVFSPPQACRRLAEHIGPVALIFGPEASGLTNSDLELCQALTTIPMAPSRHSLNLSHAVQIYAYEMQRVIASTQAGTGLERPSAEQLEHLIRSWEN